MNPIWHSLDTRHLGIAITNGPAKRYPPDIAPFVAVAEPTAEAAASLLEIVQPGESVGILNLIPPMEFGWELQNKIEIHQYVWRSEKPVQPSQIARLLTEKDILSMLELTALVYPAYFRPGTARLGDYFGWFEGDRLAAMAGIRMAMDGYQELSAICTHPDYRGRGLAAELTLHLVSEIRARGEVAFLHTESYNLAAKSLYEKLGFSLTRKLPFQVLQRI